MTSLFGGGSNITVNASGTLVPQQFTPTANQTLFTLTLFQYTINTNSLLVFINGNLQVPGVDYTETSSSTFTLTSPVGVNDSVRAIGFPLATFFQAGVGVNLTDIPTVATVQNALYSWMGITTGTPGAQIGIPTPAPVAVTAGMVFRFLAGFTSTGSTTLNGITIKKPSAGGLINLIAGDLVAGAAYQVVFDGTYYQLAGSGSGGGATGGGADQIFQLNSTTMTAPFTIPTGKNAFVVGPLQITANNPLTVTGRLVVM